MKAKVVIWDIDGTLANCNHRLHHILETVPPDWDAFDAATMDDTPIKQAITLNRILYFFAIPACTRYPFLKTIILTGRNERNKSLTETWLKREGVLYDKLEMRKLRDYRPASVVKLERLEEMELTPAKVLTIFEDDPKVVKALRDVGYHVCCVDDREYIEPKEKNDD